MNLKIGAIIRKLRIENNVTQDTLATAIGVTPQAVSRWEAESGYPDIELLPAIADFFSISTDELLGYKRSEREERLLKIKKEIARLSEVGTIEERIRFTREAASQYPSDWEIKNELTVCLYHLWNDRRDDSMLPEIEILCQSVIDNCKEEEIRHSAVTTLSSLYAKVKRPDKALEMINQLVPMIYCREFVLAAGVGDGKTERYIQDVIGKLTDHLGYAIQNLVLNEDLPNDSSTWSKKIEMIRRINQLYVLIYGEDLMFYHSRLSFNHWIISTYTIAQGKVEETLDVLEEMCRHAVAYEHSYRNDHGKDYSSILVDHLVYPKPGPELFPELSEHSHSFYLLDRLQDERYDSIRGHERFVATVNELCKYAR